MSWEIHVECTGIRPQCCTRWVDPDAADVGEAFESAVRAGWVQGNNRERHIYCPGCMQWKREADEAKAQAA